MILLVVKCRPMRSLRIGNQIGVYRDFGTLIVVGFPGCG
jgi:hypothetical protein